MSIDLKFGDCLELMKNIPDGSVDLTVTSPPYDNLRTYNGNIKQWNFEKFKDIAKELYRVTAGGGVVIWIVADATIKGSETGTSFRQALHFMDCGFNLHDTMIWHKISPFQHKIDIYRLLNICLCLARVNQKQQILYAIEKINGQERKFTGQKGKRTAKQKNLAMCKNPKK